MERGEAVETRTYIVRVYKRNERSGTRGTVECIPSGRISAFRSTRELNMLLRQPTAPTWPGPEAAAADSESSD